MHIIFHIKTTSPCILDDDLKRVHAYIGEIINDSKCMTIWVDGVGDHVYVLCLLGREVSIAQLVETKRFDVVMLHIMLAHINTTVSVGQFRQVVVNVAAILEKKATVPTKLSAF